ncbi:SHOCT domain-containing protein [Planobispora takensis]|uniref:SHOCT domain-containing protein n=1 Tax=Planobispora takensis TaxID=1367882 RepID=A0A8J3T8P4_9ACTN|nr:SHOCT domain-containing protein [Planobispora takensis]GII06153.1 hypothetical protein Pta02_81610 [Planobispora takensis]
MNALPMAAGPWDGWGHHMWGGGSAWLWGSLMMLVWVSLIALGVWLVIRAASDRRPSRPAGRPGVERAREVLADRYAKGEISTEEYQERLAYLGTG